MTDAAAPTNPPPGGIRRLGSVAAVLAATGVAGGLGYVIQALVGIGLTPAEYTRFGIFWGAVYLVVGGIAGIQQEVARATHRAEPGRHTHLPWDPDPVRADRCDCAGSGGERAGSLPSGAASSAMPRSHPRLLCWPVRSLTSDWRPSWECSTGGSAGPP